MLKKTLKIELKKVFASKMFWIALLFGLCLAVGQVVQTAKYVQWVNEGSDIHPSGFDSTSLLVFWLGVDNRTAIGSVFFLALPILASMPFGASYFMERKTGYLIQIITRSGRKAYLYAKWMAAFISGTLVIMLPLLLNLMANALICPLGKVRILSLVVYVGQESFASKLFYSHPLGYILVSLILSSVWGGICATISLTMGMFLKNKILIILSPLILLHFIGLLMLQIKGWTGFTNWEVRPTELMRTICMVPNPTWYVIGYMSVLFAGILIVYRKWGMSCENV